MDSKIVLRAIAFLNGVEKVPPTETPATGRLMLKATLDTIHYQLETSHIGELVSAKLHLGIRGHNGPVIANLLKGQLSDVIVGQLKMADFVGNMEGIPLAILYDEIVNGHIYLEVVGDHVIRGQVGLVRKNFQKKQ